MQIHHNALILVADGQRYRFLRNHGDFNEPDLRLEGEAEHISGRTNQIGTDEPGRAFSSFGSIRSAVEQTDFHQLEKDEFAARTADLLGRRAQGGDFEELIVVAPPRTLAELRKHYDRDVTARIVGEIDKDLTKHSVEQITQLLSVD